MKVTQITYARLWSLGNYENEKIEMTATVEAGADLQKAYLELRKTVLDAHDYNVLSDKVKQASEILRNPDNHYGYQVKQATDLITEFQKRFPMGLMEATETETEKTEA